MSWYKFGVNAAEFEFKIKDILLKNRDARNGEEVNTCGENTLFQDWRCDKD